MCAYKDYTKMQETANVDLKLAFKELKNMTVSDSCIAYGACFRLTHVFKCVSHEQNISVRLRPLIFDIYWQDKSVNVNILINVCPQFAPYKYKTR